MPCISRASHQTVSTTQPHCTGVEDGEPPVGRAMPAAGSRGRQVWLHGLALLPQERRAEAYSRHGQSCRDRPWHESVAEERTEAWRQEEISTSGSALGAIAAYPSLSCRAERGKENATGHRVWLFFNIKQPQAVGRSPDCHFTENFLLRSVLGGPAAQEGRGGGKTVPVLKQLES